MLATIQELRTNTKALLDKAASGEDVTISCHGKQTVRIVGLKSSDSERKKAVDGLFGIWKDRTDLDSVEETVRALRRGRIR